MNWWLVLLLMVVGGALGAIGCYVAFIYIWTDGFKNWMGR
jgi:hypothetical protein